jgi:hypothetical protein
MTPSFAAFLDELDKIADVQPASWDRARATLGRALVGGAAMGLGAGLGHALTRSTLPRILPHASERTIRFLRGGGTALGAAGALALTSALARHNQMLEAGR